MRTCWMVLTLAFALTATGETTPERVLVIGDSMMRVTAHAIELQISRRGVAESRSFTSLGSGLARLDSFDWMEKIDELIAEFNPDVTIAWFGTNDHQPMSTVNGIIRPGDPAWAVEYGRRVGEAMDKLTAAAGSRIIWLELPDMRDNNLQRDVDLINAIVVEQAVARNEAVYFPTRSLLSRRPGTFSMHVAGPTGMPLSIRDADGVHLNRAGADRVAESVLSYLFDGGQPPP